MEQYCACVHTKCEESILCNNCHCFGITGMLGGWWIFLAPLRTCQVPVDLQQSFRIIIYLATKIPCSILLTQPHGLHFVSCQQFRLTRHLTIFQSIHHCWISMEKTFKTFSIIAVRLLMGWAEQVLCKISIVNSLTDYRGSGLIG